MSLSVVRYPGTVYSDGIGAMISFIRASNETVTLLAIAPATNFPELLTRAPDVVNKTRVVAMSGSVYRGYDNSTVPAAEYNVAVCPQCTAQMYAMGTVTSTPLDTCGTVRTLLHVGLALSLSSSSSLLLVLLMLVVVDEELLSVQL